MPNNFYLNTTSPFQTYKRIVIILPDMIGTTICSLPALASIYKSVPNKATLTVVGFENIADVLIDEPYYSNIVFASMNNVGGVLKDVLLSKNPDILIDFLSSRDSAKQIKLYAKTRVSVGFANYDNNPYLIMNNESHANNSSVLDYINLIQQLGIIPTTKTPKLSTSEKSGLISKDALLKKGLLKNDRIISLGVGAGNKKKRWPLNNYIILSNELNAWHKTKSIFITGPKDEDLHVYLRNMNLLNIHCESLAVLKGILFHSSLAICNDYGIMHIAGAVGVPTIGVFLSSDPLQWFPYNLPSKYVVGSYLPCRPCYSENCLHWKCNQPQLYDNVLKCSHALL